MSACRLVTDYTSCNTFYTISLPISLVPGTMKNRQQTVRNGRCRVNNTRQFAPVRECARARSGGTLTFREYRDGSANKSQLSPLLRNYLEIRAPPRHANYPIRDRLHRTSHYESPTELGSAGKVEKNMLPFAYIGSCFSYSVLIL